MVGAILGDIVGSVYEFSNIKTKDFPLFCQSSSYTDDSIMTIAVADWLLHKGDLAKVMQYYGKKYPCPMGGYGSSFVRWLNEEYPNLIIAGEMVRQCVSVLLVGILIL